MVINRDSIKFYETFNINLTDSVLIKLEDAVRKKKEMLITIDASHYGFRNGNGTIYRHDTVANDIHTFVSPKPKPIIQQHRPDTSEVFGKVIAADYKLTDYYDKLSKKYEIEGLDTEGYIDFCKDTLLPFQKGTPGFNGLAYVQLVGKLESQKAIGKVLDGGFLTVSIGADPIRLICSECLQDQTNRMCSHFANKSGNIFMLSESLRYEELSFVSKPADPYGRIVKIHDGQKEEFKIEREGNCLSANVDVIEIKDFFSNINSGKKIICVDNICTIINQEEQMKKKKSDSATITTMSLNDEFSTDQLKSVKLSSGDDISVEALKLSDSETIDDKSFAIVQKTSDGLIRRFPLVDALNVEVALRLIDQADDLTDSEKAKALSSLERAAKKMDVKIEDAQAKEVPKEDNVALEDSDNSDANASTGDDTDPQESVTDTPITFEKLCDSLKASIESFDISEITLTDEEETTLTDAEKAEKTQRPNPVSVIFSLVASLGRDLKWAGDMLEGSILAYLTDLGKETVAKGTKDELDSKVAGLTDELTEAREEIELLDEQNRELNFQLRTNLVDELISMKASLGLVDSEDNEEEKTKLSKLPYNVLCDQISDYRKIKNNIKDSSVNNTVDIKTIADPTLTDSDGGTEDNNSDIDISLNDSEPIVMSFEEKVRLFKSLFR